MYTGRKAQNEFVNSIGELLEEQLTQNGLESCVGAADIGRPWKHVVVRKNDKFFHYINFNINPTEHSVSKLTHSHIPTCYGHSRRYKAYAKNRFDIVRIEYSTPDNVHNYTTEIVDGHISACLQHYNKQNPLSPCHLDL
jgi:hypothetical protein